MTSLPSLQMLNCLFFSCKLILVACLWLSLVHSATLTVGSRCLELEIKKDLNKIKLLIMFFSSAAAASSYVKIDASILLWQKPCYLLSPDLTAITTNAAAFITTHTVATAVKLDSNHFYSFLKEGASSEIIKQSAMMSKLQFCSNLLIIISRSKTKAAKRQLIVGWRMAIKF